MKEAERGRNAEFSVAELDQYLRGIFPQVFHADSGLAIESGRRKQAAWWPTRHRHNPFPVRQIADGVIIPK
jgi:hypothetical protein